MFDDPLWRPFKQNKLYVQTFTIYDVYLNNSAKLEKNQNWTSCQLSITIIQVEVLVYQ